MLSEVSATNIDCDIGIIGGSMGGVAAALAACQAGLDVVLTEATDWLGGQMTSQGVSALDEYKYIEEIPPSRAYAEMRERIRQHYVSKYAAPAIMPTHSGDFAGLPLNPGNGWVSRLCFEPRVGVQVLEAMLAPHVASGRLKILLNHEPVSAQVEDDRVVRVAVEGATKKGARHFQSAWHLNARYFLDATDLGDLLPLTHTAYVTGAEAKADTGEPHATPTANPNETQGFTYCFAVEHREGESHVIEKPKDYERLRDAQPFTFTLYGHDQQPRYFRMWHNNEAQDLLPFWTYRRLLDAKLLDPTGARGLHDVTMINWPGNDYFGANVIDASQANREAILHEAKQLALAFLYWLQTEAPHDDSHERGYPGLKLLPEVMGTRDGLSKFPYIRESRRIIPLKRILEQHISSEDRLRAEIFEDSVGIGWYSIDIHHCVGADPKNPAATAFAPTHPFQIPLGALIPIQTRNLIAACKNIGTTHLTNGAYRLHPVEWAIGEAAGALAAYCCEASQTPRQVWESPAHTSALQERLRARGVNLSWPADVRSR
jgi:hypothetical protein